MAHDISKQQQDINRKIDDTCTRIEQLKSEEHVVSEELKQLNTQRQRFSVLSEVSDRLEKLEKLGGSDLFWGEDHNHETAALDQKRIRNLIINFDSRVAKLREKQNSQVDSFASLNAKVNILNEESVNLQELEDDLALEFIIEREPGKPLYREMQMPWNKQDADQNRFRNVLLIVLFFSTLLGILIPMWQIPIPDRIKVVEIPERIAKLMVLKQEPPPPPPPPKKEEKPEELKPEKKVEDKVEKKIDKPVPKKPAKTVARSGLMEFKDDFADLIDDAPAAKLGAQAKISGKGTKAKKTTRSLVTASVGKASGGINTAALSRNVGGSGKSIGGVEFSRVESAIGSDFFGEERPLSEGPGPSRTDEEIQIVFDRFKSALYRIYNRELRKNPTLQGKMVLRITIEPDGSVSASSVDSSDIDSDTLGKKIAARVKKFNFGVKEGVPAITILYPIDFLPAS